MLGDAQPANAIDPRDQAVVQLFKTTQRAMERTADKLEDISVAVHTIDKRLAVIEAGSLEREIERLGESVSDMASRLGTLEDESHKRAGATSVVMAIARSPAIAWLFGAAAAVWAYLQGAGK